MGSSCGIKKTGTMVITPKYRKNTLNDPFYYGKQDTMIDVTADGSSPDSTSQTTQFSMKELAIGHYFMESQLRDHTSRAILSKSKKRLDQWRAMAGFGVEGSIDERIKNRNATPMGKTRYIDVDCDVQILEADAEIGLSNFKKANPRKFSVRVGKGAPTRYRWLGWKIQANIRHFIIPGKYDEYKTKGCLPRCLNEIEKDIGRTFPEHPLFSIDKNGFIGQEALKNVLKAYACYNSNVGYCQGMNFIVGFLLIISGLREEETFWMFVALANYKITSDPLSLPGIDGFYIEYFPLLKVLIAIFDMQFHEKIPELKEHFDNTGFDPVLWLHKWFQTLFLYSYPLAFCIRIWDAIFSNGISFIIPFSLTMLRLLEKSLLEKDFSAINDEIKNIKENTILPFPDYIIKQALKVRVDWKTLDRQFLEVYRIVRQEQVEYEKKKRRYSGANLLELKEDEKITEYIHKRHSFQDMEGVKDVEIEEIINSYDEKEEIVLPELNIIKYESKRFPKIIKKLTFPREGRSGERSPNRITFSESRNIPEWKETKKEGEEELRLPPLPEPKPFIVEDKVLMEQVRFVGVSTKSKEEEETLENNSIFSGLPPSPVGHGDIIDIREKVNLDPIQKQDIMESLEKLSQISNSCVHSPSSLTTKRFITLRSLKNKRKKKRGHKKPLYRTEKDGIVCIASLVKYPQEIEENIEGEGKNEGDVDLEPSFEHTNYLIQGGKSSPKSGGGVITIEERTPNNMKSNIINQLMNPQEKDKDSYPDIGGYNQTASPSISQLMSSTFFKDSEIYKTPPQILPSTTTNNQLKVNGFKFATTRRSPQRRESDITRRELDLLNGIEIPNHLSPKKKIIQPRFKNQKIMFVASPQINKPI